MPHSHETMTIDADPGSVWSLAGDPARIAEWLPALETSEAQRDRRNCTFADGGEIVERILERNAAGRCYEYEMTESPLPVRSYRSRLAFHGPAATPVSSRTLHSSRSARRTPGS